MLFTVGIPKQFMPPKYPNNYESMTNHFWVKLPLKEEVIPPYYKLLPKEE